MKTTTKPEEPELTSHYDLRFTKVVSPDGGMAEDFEVERVVPIPTELLVKQPEVMVGALTLVSQGWSLTITASPERPDLTAENKRNIDWFVQNVNRTVQAVERQVERMVEDLGGPEALMKKLQEAGVPAEMLGPDCGNPDCPVHGHKTARAKSDPRATLGYL